MNQSNFQKRRSADRGSALIELALVIPAVLIFVFAGLEAVSALRHEELTTTLSRELASQSFRECSADFSGFGDEKFDPGVCLEQHIRPLFKSRFERILPKAEFVVSIYSIEPGTKNLQSATLVETKPGSNFISSYDVNRVQTELNGAGGPDTVGSALEEFHTVVVAEVAIPHPAFWRFVPKLLGQRADWVYASTVI